MEMIPCLPTDQSKEFDMELAKTVHAFQTGGAKKAFALSHERTGANLPKDRGWRYWKPFPDKHISEDAQEALREFGFWVPAELPDAEVIIPEKVKPRIAKRR